MGAWGKLGKANCEYLVVTPALRPGARGFHPPQGPKNAEMNTQAT